jgi:beta-glucosidase
MLAEALEVSKNADVIVAALGESAEMSGESSSRSNIELPDAQKTLLMELVKTGKPVVLVLLTGRPLAIKWESEHVPAILNTWFGGSEAGFATADVLFGKLNPSGKLTTTFPQNVGQLPIYYAHHNTGRPLPEGKWFQKFRSNYLDVSNEPVYPFGYGLSYTKFTYSNMSISSSTLTPAGALTASITVTNSGNMDGKEVVQLYIRDMVGSITRPVKELKGFQKISLRAGESRTVSFRITAEDLLFYISELKYVAEPCEFRVMIGTNSRYLSEKTFILR